MVQTGDRSKRVERTDVEFPLWRKKVDNSIFRHGGTTGPNWAAKMWDLDHFFPGMRGKKDESSRTILRFEKSQFEGWVTDLTGSFCTKRFDRN